MPLDGLGDGFKTGAATAMVEVADSNKVQLSGPNGTNHPRSGGIAIHGVQYREPPITKLDQLDWINYLDTKMPKVTPSGSGDNIAYSFGLYTPQYSSSTLATIRGRNQFATDPFPVGNEIFSLKDNAAYTSVKRVESIATQFGEGWDYSILKASVPSVKDGDKDSTLYAELWTDVASAGENDYMVGGWWLLAPNNPTGDYRFGTFARAENYYPRSGTGSIKADVTGSATYKGNAAGLHTSSDNGMVSIQRLLGKVTLTAEFGDATARGTIEGRIDSLTLDGESATGEILLPEATLGSLIADFQVPVTTANQLSIKTNIGNIKGINYRGDWFGTFQGDSSGMDQPTGIIGVVGGSGGSNSFVASFGAKKVEDED